MLPRLSAPEIDNTPEALRLRIQELERRLEIARHQYETERNQRLDALREAPEVQRLYSMLRFLFDGVPTNGDGPSTANDGPLTPDRYFAWKQKYGGRVADAIDILVKYEGGLTRNQLASALGVQAGSGTMGEVISTLKTAGLFVKDGNLIRLKRL